MLKSLTLAALFVLPIPIGPQNQPAKEQPKTVTRQNQVTATATIRAIDHAKRSVTLRMENGDEDSFTVGPEVTRFDQLKVGDTISVTYYEALVFQLRKPGMPSTPSTDALAGGRLKDVPGGAVGAQQTRTVTVKAVDLNAPSITVVTEDGRTLTRKVADKTVLEGVSPGDRIDITYSQAVMVHVAARQ